MASKIDLIPLGNKILKKSSKLLDCQIERIKEMYFDGFSIHSLSRCFSVSRRLIQFTLFPERLEANKLKRKERGGSKVYYNKAKHSKAVKDHRIYKKSLLKQ